MKIQNILQEFKTCEGYFPYDAVQAAIEQQQEITPILLSLITEVIDKRETFENDRMDFILALSLLGKFREKRLFQVILELSKLPEEEVEFLLGDMVTQGLANVMVSTYDGNLQGLKDLIEDEYRDVWFRGAGLHTLLGLVADNQLERQEVITYLQNLLKMAPIIEDEIFMGTLVHLIGSLHANELMDRVEYIFEFYEFDPVFADLTWAREALSMDRDECLKKYLFEDIYIQPVDDIQALIGWMQGFNEPSSPTLPAFKLPKIGRNDPCMCGSKKKFKKCCLNEMGEEFCGICGSTNKVVQTNCCDNWICDDDYEFDEASEYSTSCYRSHRDCTICGVHWDAAHQGAWQDCKICKDTLRLEIYAYYATNDFNFEKLPHPPQHDPLHCSECKGRLTLGKDACMYFDKKYFCSACKSFEENDEFQVH